MDHDESVQGQPAKWPLSLAGVAQGTLPSEMAEGFTVGPRIWHAIRDEASLRGLGMKIVLHFEADGRHSYATARHYRPADLGTVANSLLFRRQMIRLVDARAMAPTADEQVSYSGCGPFFACPATHILVAPDGSRLLVADEDVGCVSWFDFISDPFPAIEVNGVEDVLRASKEEV